MTTATTARKLSPSGAIRALKRRKLYLLLPALLLMPGVYYFAQHMTARFHARALVGKDPSAAGQLAFGSRPEIAATISAQDQLRLVRETILNRPILETIASELPLKERSPGPKHDKALDELKARIRIQVESTENLHIGYEGSDPVQVARIANRLADLFIERTADRRGQRMEKEDTFLDEEVDRLRRDLDRQEGGVKAFKQNLAQMLPDRLATNFKQIEYLQQQIQAKTDQTTEGEARRASIVEELQALEKQGVLEPEPRERTSSEIALDQMRLKLNEMNTKYTEEHPEIKRLKKEIRDLEAITVAPAAAVRRPPSAERLRHVALQAELKSIEPRLQKYREERADLVSQLKAVERKTDATPGYEAALSDRTRDSAVARSRYEALFAKQQELKLSHRAEKSTSHEVYRVLERAEVPTVPVGLPPKRVILLGLAACMGIGLLGVFLAERLDTSFQTSEEFENFTNLPVLTSVPTIPSPRLTIAGGRDSTVAMRLGLVTDRDRLSPERRQHFRRHRLSVLSDPNSVASQQYGILALKVTHWAEQSGKRMLAVTSAAGDEGKSITASNLSLALASCMEGRVLLVDCDLRLSQLSKRLGLEAEEGFSDLVVDGSNLFTRYISRVGNLDVLSGGKIPADPAALLASQKTRELFARLRETYNLIVLDTPPIVPIVDTHILAGLADGVVLVVRARQTKSELFRRAVESLGGSNVIGVVLNDVEYADTPYAYAYSYHTKRQAG